MVKFGHQKIYQTLPLTVVLTTDVYMAVVSTIIRFQWGVLAARSGFLCPVFPVLCSCKAWWVLSGIFGQLLGDCD